MVQGGLAKKDVWHPLAWGCVALGLTDSYWIMKQIFDIQMYLCVVWHGAMVWSRWVRTFCAACGLVKNVKGPSNKSLYMYICNVLCNAFKLIKVQHLL